MIPLITDKNQIAVEKEGGSKLRECIAEQFVDGAVANKIYTKLHEVGVVDVDSLIFCDDKDLSELCAELQLSLAHKMKFKAFVRKIKYKYQPKQKQNVVTITSNEQQIISNIDFATRQSNSLHHAFEEHFNQIDPLCIRTKHKINTTIDKIIQSLLRRKEVLLNKVILYIFYLFTYSMSSRIINQKINE